MSPSAKKFRPGYTRPSGKSQRYIPKPIPQELGNLKVYSKLNRNNNNNSDDDDLIF